MALNKARIASHIRTRYNKLNGDQQGIFETAAEHYQMYRSVMSQSDTYPWDYQLVDPQIFPLVRAHLSRLNPQEAKVLLEPRRSEVMEIKDVNQQVLNWELEEILLTQIFYRLMFRGFITGKSYLKSGWKYEPAVKVKGNNGDKIMREIVNRGDLKNVRFNDIFIPNRNNPELMEQPYIIERVSMRFGEMEDMNKEEEYWNKKYLEKIKEKRIFDSRVEYGVDTPQDDTEAKDDDILTRSQYVKMLCMHTLDGEVFYTMEKENNWILNKNTENEYWHGHYPYIDFTPFPEDDEFFSLGIVQPVADLQVAMSSVLNQLLTNARKAGNPMWIAGQTASQTPDWQFVNRPDGVIRVVGTVDQIQPVITKDTSGPLINLRTELQTAFERGSSLSTLYTTGAGSSPQINKTATGAKIIDQNIDINLQMLISLFGAQILKRVGEHFLELNAQYITEGQTLAITGKEGKSEFVNVDPQQISANFNVKVSPERMLKQSPALRQASLLNLFNTLREAKKDGVPINLKPVTESIIDAYPETENIDNIMIDPEQKANEVIDAIHRGIEPPEARFDDDHKAIVSLLQKHMIDMPDMPDEQIMAFTEYIDSLTKWIDAKKMQLLAPPTPPAQLQGLDEQSLMQSLGGQGQLPVNPGAELPVPLSQDQLGILPGDMSGM